MNPDRPAVPDPDDRLPIRAAEPNGTFEWRPPPPPPKFQHRYRTHILLFVATLLTTTMAGAEHFYGFTQMFGGPKPPSFWWLYRHGLWYSLPILIILGAHEFGHYVYCRRHSVDATLPYFIPAPLFLTGTFGAVIRIRQAFPTKRALFDIGVAGPLAGFFALLPFLYLGIHWSRLIHLPQDASGIYFGEPLLWKALSRLHFGVIPDGFDIVPHPMAFAAWWGMLATALNLLPFGQLDGGHIAYSIFGRRAGIISIMTLAGTMLLTLRSVSWISMTIMMLIMAFVLGVRHPRIIDEHTPLDRPRQLVALAALIVFVLCFTPVPIQTFLGK